VIKTQRKLRVMIGMLTSHSQSRFTKRDSLRNVIKANAVKLVPVSAWLEGPPKKRDQSDSAFIGEKIYTKLSIQYNTAVLSSASVERFFSQGKDIMKAKRSSLSDETLEMLMFMRGNKHHLRGINDS
jgi:hypothetical protein